MEKAASILAARSENRESSQMDEFFFKRLALSGPGLNFLIRAADFKIIFCNRQFEHYLGFTNSEVNEGEIYFTALLEDYQVEQFKNQLNNVKKHLDAQSHFVWYRLRGKSGCVAGYYLYAAPFFDERCADNNEDLFHLTMHPDLSRWREPFISFTSRELFRENIDKEESGTFEWIQPGGGVLWSDGLIGIYELDTDRHPVHSPFDKTYIHPNDQNKVIEELERAIVTGEDMAADFKIITTKQNIKVIECLARITKNDNGGKATMSGSLRDITRRKSVEDNLKIKMKELHQSNKDLEEFAYIASHDLQEPLRKITTFSDWLSAKYKDILSGDGAMYLSRITAAAANMRSLINDLLEFSRIPKSDQAFESVSLDQIMMLVKTDLELTIAETMTVFYCQPLPVIEAAPSQMKQLFSNIIGNALKFKKRDVAPVITIETTLLSATEKLQYDLVAEAAYHKIQITDNGIGFEKEYAAKIFQVFQRLHGKSEYPGSGIGLAICKKIVENHNGLIYAENIDGTGARFVIILPQQHNTNLTG